MKKTSEKSKTSQVVQCKEYTWQCRGCKRYGFIPWVRKILWNRKWQPTPVFLPGKLHGQRSLVGYNPWGCKESDMTVIKQTKQNIQYVNYICHILYKYIICNVKAGVKQQYMLLCCVVSVVSHVQPFCDPMDCSPSGFSVHGISYGKILEWVAISFSKGNSQPRDQTSLSCIGRQILYY